MLKIYNTLTRQVEEFKPRSKKEVGFYACGPTVYHYAHIGNLRAYVAQDILRRTLKYNHYKVRHIMNITDVGHLTDDADAGEDKMEAGARREGKNAWEIARYYTEAFKQNLQDLNVLTPTIWCAATDHIQEQINQVQELIDGGFTYETADGIYFDTTRVADYGKLARLSKQSLQAGKRVSLGEKKNPPDFALWKWSRGDRQMEWAAFGKMGFPGWHIECSAMSMKYLGDQFDLHAGGVDHIPVHHTNEIAQAESITGLKPWVKYWFHNEFLLIKKDLSAPAGKMSKAKENFITLSTLTDKGFSPLAFRYLLLQTHYRKQLTFSWEALAAAQTGLNHLREQIKRISPNAPTDPIWEEKFLDLINADLNTPEALALVWEALSAKQISEAAIIQFDKILGLDLHNIKKKLATPKAIQALLLDRAAAREQKDWTKSDQLRKKIEKFGYQLEDGPDGQKIHKK